MDKFLAYVSVEPIYYLSFLRCPFIVRLLAWDSKLHPADSFFEYTFLSQIHPSFSTSCPPFAPNMPVTQHVSLTSTPSFLGPAPRCTCPSSSARFLLFLCALTLHSQLASYSSVHTQYHACTRLVRL